MARRVFYSFNYKPDSWQVAPEAIVALLIHGSEYE